MLNRSNRFMVAHHAEAMLRLAVSVDAIFSTAPADGSYAASIVEYSAESFGRSLEKLAAECGFKLVPADQPLELVSGADFQGEVPALKSAVLS